MPRRSVYIPQCAFCSIYSTKPFLARIKRQNKADCILLHFISEGMEFERRWLLLFHQSAAADRGGEHPLDGAGTAGHRIRTAAGNDCVIRPQEHSALYRHSRHMHTADPVYTLSTQTQLYYRIRLHLLPELLICFPSGCRSSCLAVSFLKKKRRGTTLVSAYSSVTTYLPFIEDI